MPTEPLPLGPFRGLVLDRSPVETGVSAARVARNARVRRGRLETSPGLSALKGSPVTGRVLHGRTWKNDAATLLTNIVTRTNIYKYDGTTFTSLKSGLTGGATSLWDLAVFNPSGGSPKIVFTNNVDAPQTWDGAAATTSNIGGGAPSSCRSMAYFQNYFLMLDTTEVGVRYPRRLRWADNGTLTFTGGDSSFLTLYQGNDLGLRLLSLGEQLIAYKEHSIHGIMFTADQFVFSQRQVISDEGLFAQRAVADLGARHAFLGNNNLWLFDGVRIEPIGDQVIDQIYADIDPQYFDQTALEYDAFDAELIIAIPPIGSNGSLDKQYVLNMRTGDWHTRDYPVTGFGRWRSVTALTWDTVAGSWDDLFNSWDHIDHVTNFDFIICGDNAGNVYRVNSTVVDIGLTSPSRDYQSGLFDPSSVLASLGIPGFRRNIAARLVKLEVEYETKGSWNLEVSIAAVASPDNAVSWTAKNLSMDGSALRVWFNIVGRYFAIRVRTTGSGQSYRISRILAYFTPAGDR